MKTLHLVIVLVLLVSMTHSAAYAQLNDCGKNTIEERNSILNSVDKQKAILIATNDTDFKGLVGNSKYIAGAPTVGSEGIYQLDCKLVNPNIQIQFNILDQNANLGNCPYVMVIEDPSASKVLAVDLGSCSTHITPPRNSPIAESSLSTMVIIGGIAVSTVVGISFFVMRVKK